MRNGLGSYATTVASEKRLVFTSFVNVTNLSSMMLRILGSYEIRPLDVFRVGPAACDRFLVESESLGDLNGERDRKQRTARSVFQGLY